MDKQRWTGVLVGVAATILLLGGLVTAGATAMSMGGMGGMMDECREMMEDHGHGDGGGHDDGNGTQTASDDGAHAGPSLVAAGAGDATVNSI